MNDIIKITDEEHREFLKSIGVKDPDKQQIRVKTEEEKEGSMFIKMSKIVERMISTHDLTKEKWDELIRYGMVYSKDTENGIEYYMTEKALDWIEGIKDPNFNFKRAVLRFRKGSSLRLVKNKDFYEKLKKKTKGGVDDVLE